MIVVTIPQPCHEKWDEMLPEAKGRFCSSCEKIVVDFSSMSDDEVKNYLLLNTHQKTCGRFLSSQVNRPLENKPFEINPQWYGQLPYARQVFYAIALFFVLGVSSCTIGAIEKTQPEKLAATERRTTVGAPITTISEDLTTPSPIPVKPTVVFLAPETTKCEEVKEENNRISGLVAIEMPAPNKKLDSVVVKIEEPEIMGDVQMGEPNSSDTLRY